MKKLSKKILITLLSFILLIITISAVNASETNITYSDNLGQTVQNASNGDTINLATGTYKNNATNITISKNLTIQGKDPKTTIIDAEQLGRIFTITTGGSLILKNITLCNGYSNDSSSTNWNGGAIRVDNGIINIDNCIFNNNIAQRGGAIFIVNNNNSCVNNSIFTNNFALAGGAIDMYMNVNYITIDNCDFTNNTAYTYGGAIYNSYNGSHITIANSNFTSNTLSIGGGGAINIENGFYYTLIKNCIFINNQAPQGGAIDDNNGNYMTVDGCIFINNTANRTGGGIVNFGNMIIKNSIFINNTALSSDGGGIATTGNNVLIYNCNFIGNKAKDGSAINSGLRSAVNITISTSNFTNNKGGRTIFILNNFSAIKYCNIFNNEYGVMCDSNSNLFVNYNRIFNNTNGSGYDLENTRNLNANYNWWGSNNPLVYGIELDTYFIMNVINLTSLDSNGTVTFNYTFRLNTGEDVDNSLLPYFITEVYTNLTTGVITSFDARYDNTFDVTVNQNGSILYSFVTDNEVQTLEGNAVIPIPPEPPIPPIPPTPTPDPVDPDDPTPTPNNNKTSNNPTASAVMKETGIPINLILLAFCSVLAVLIGRKQN